MIGDKRTGQSVESKDNSLHESIIGDERTNKQTNKFTNEQTNKQKNKQKNKKMNACMHVHKKPDSYDILL